MIKAVIFDLDGVIVSTDNLHYLAWLEMAKKENLPFDKTINNRLRGVSRKESLEIILENANRYYSEQEKDDLMAYKNKIYIRLLDNLSKTDILPNVTILLSELKKKQIKIAIGSSSKNAKIILKRIGLLEDFDAIADGNDIENSKPDPEVFLIAASRLAVYPENSLVVEDAFAGIEAAKRAGMQAFAVGDAINCEQADYKSSNLLDILELV